MTDVLKVLKYLYPQADFVTRVLVANNNGTQQIVRWDETLGSQPTAQQLADTEASAGFIAWDLLNYKKLKIAAIQARTTTLLATGFVYDGQQFDISTHVQLRLNGIQAKKLRAPNPVPLLTKTGALYNLPKNDIDLFTDAAFDRGFAVTNGETQLIGQVMAAANKAAVDAIADDRT